MTDVWYRFEEVTYSPGVDEYGDVLRGDGDVRLWLYRLPVLKLTPKGAWIETQYGRRRFVLRGALKRYACPTVKEAAASYHARKRAQIRIYSARIRAAERGIDRLINSDWRFL